MRAAIIIINLIVAYMLLSGWPESLPVWVRAGIALIVVMIAVPLGDAARKNSERARLIRLSSIRVPKWLDYLYIGAVIFCIELLLFAAFTLGPETTENMHEDVKYWLNNSEETDEVVVEAPGKLSHEEAGNWLWDNHFRRSHPKRASKRPPNKPEIYMQISSKYNRALLQKYNIYLRTFALDHFDGDTWSIHQPTKLIIEKPNKGRIQISSVNGTWRSSLPLYDHVITQPYYRNGQNLLTALQNTINTDVQTLVKVSTDTYTLPPLTEDRLGYSYKVTSQPVLLDHIITLDKDIVPGSPPDEVYLSKVTNARLQSKLTQFTSSIDRTLPLVQQLSALKTLINDQCSYSLEIKNKSGINALENFLFEEKSGYCEFYASAAAMLCRELGIPSRIAFGWSGGKFFESSGLFIFRSKDAHAWTEIYLDNYGWMIYDTTPPSENAMTRSQQDEVSPELSDFIEYPDDELLGEYPDVGPITWIRVLIILSAVLLTVIAILIIRRCIFPRQRSMSGAYMNSELRYLKLFQKVSAKLGHPVKPGKTLMQSVQYLKDQHADDRGMNHLLDKLFRYHYGTVYRNVPLDKVAESEITSELKKILKQLD